MEKAKYQKQFGQRLKRVRVHFGCSQQAFASRLKTSQPTVVRLEGGTRAVEGYLIMMVVEQFGCNVEWLVTGEGGPGLDPGECGVE